MIDKWLVRVITPAIIVKYTISLDYNCIVWKFRLLCLVDWVLSSCFLENVFKTPRKLWIFRFVFSESWNNFCWGTINNLVSTPATPSMSWNNPGTIKCCLGHNFSCNYYPDVVISSCKSYKRVAQPRTEPSLINIVLLTTHSVSAPDRLHRWPVVLFVHRKIYQQKYRWSWLPV